MVFEGTRRYYVENLEERDYTLENTIPYEITFGDTVIEEHSWGNLICAVVDLLLEKFPHGEEFLLGFSVPWSKKKIFATNQKTNYKKVSNGLYVNCNHTALHSCWLIQDLLDHFSVNKGDVTLLIHRSPAAEPKEVRECIESTIKESFCAYLLKNCEKTDDECRQIISDFEDILNPLLKKVSPSYNNFFLFDSRAYLSGYIKKINEKIETNIPSEIDKERLRESIKLLTDFYKDYEKKWRIIDELAVNEGI